MKCPSCENGTLAFRTDGDLNELTCDQCTLTEYVPTIEIPPMRTIGLKVDVPDSNIQLDMFVNGVKVDALSFGRGHVLRLGLVTIIDSYEDAYNITKRLREYLYPAIVNDDELSDS